MPLVVGRPKSLQALEKSEESNGLMVIVTQRILTPGDPSSEDLYDVGTLCKLESVVETEMGSKQIVVTGIARYRIISFEDRILEKGGEEVMMARGQIESDTHAQDPARAEALLNSLKTAAREVLELLPGTTEPLIRLMDKVDDSSYLSNVCAAYLNLTLAQKQELLETLEVEERMDTLLSYMRKEREVLNIQREIRDKMSERLNKAQREALLREQMKTIRAELGEEGSEDTADDLDEKIRAANPPEEAMKQAREELKRLRSLPSASAEYHVVRSYLEWIAAMPWQKTTQDKIDLARARQILDEDHYGLETVKKRILQYLAVAKLKNDLHGPILCLVGPPGVGKTSLGQSVARALGRKFIRASLGGVRDEAEIRGHRRTYVGAMPGRIIQSIKRAGVRNPVMMLDEIDKLRSDFHGDPSAAMLEVLDPEQNKAFVDHYLDVPFDLSDVFFIATANVLDTIPGPLRDRMEVIDVSGYTSVEKLHIAKKYLLPQERESHGLKKIEMNVPDETLQDVISHYTREAGVRELRRKIAGLMRSAAEQIVEAQTLKDLPEPMKPIDVTPDRLGNMLGPKKFFPEAMERQMKPGVAIGMAWTPHGGDLLFMEATRMPGKGNLILTGQLGDVMKESAHIAMSLARSTISALFPQQFDFATHDIHIHVPAGAIPKDGPSAGVTVLSAVVSLLLEKTVSSELSMTGEITLRGAVLPVGGIKEKVLAAHRAGIKTVILPKRNEHDLAEVPEEICKDLKFILVENIEEVISHLFNLRLGRVERAVKLAEPPPQPANPGTAA